jgi:hypothetical protein
MELGVVDGYLARVVDAEPVGDVGEGGLTLHYFAPYINIILTPKFERE